MTVVLPTTTGEEAPLEDGDGSLSSISIMSLMVLGDMVPEGTGAAKKRMIEGQNLLRPDSTGQRVKAPDCFLACMRGVRQLIEWCHVSHVAQYAVAEES